MKKAAILCLALFAMPMAMADSSYAVTKSQKRYCQNKAEKYADEKAFGNTVGGAIGGAVAGGILGGLIGGKGSIGTGAAIGAGVGGVGGAAQSNAKWDHYYWKKYNKCIADYY